MHIIIYGFYLTLGGIKLTNKIHDHLWQTKKSRNQFIFALEYFCFDPKWLIHALNLSHIVVSKSMLLQVNFYLLIF